MQLFLYSIGKLCIFLNLFINDVNRIATYKRYYMMIKKENKKDKNSNLKKICLKYSKKNL